MTEQDKPREKCDNCLYGNRFDPRPDELDRYGPDVMGCKLPGWEGYTRRWQLCVAWAPRHPKKDDPS